MKELVKLICISGIIGLYVWVLKRIGREIDDTDWRDIL